MSDEVDQLADDLDSHPTIPSTSSRVGTAARGRGNGGARGGAAVKVTLLSTAKSTKPSLSNRSDSTTGGAKGTKKKKRAQAKQPQPDNEDEEDQLDSDPLLPSSSSLKQPQPQPDPSSSSSSLAKLERFRFKGTVPAGLQEGKPSSAAPSSSSSADVPLVDQLDKRKRPAKEVEADEAKLGEAKKRRTSLFEGDKKKKDGLARGAVKPKKRKEELFFVPDVDENGDPILDVPSSSPAPAVHSSRPFSETLHVSQLFPQPAMQDFFPFQPSRTPRSFSGLPSPQARSPFQRSPSKPNKPSFVLEAEADANAAQFKLPSSSSSASASRSKRSDLPPPPSSFPSSIDLPSQVAYRLRHNPEVPSSPDRRSARALSSSPFKLSSGLPSSQDPEQHQSSALQPRLTAEQQRKVEALVGGLGVEEVTMLPDEEYVETLVEDEKEHEPEETKEVEQYVPSPLLLSPKTYLSRSRNPTPIHSHSRPSTSQRAITSEQQQEVEDLLGGLTEEESRAWAEEEWEETMQEGEGRRDDGSDSPVLKPTAPRRDSPDPSLPRRRRSSFHLPSSSVGPIASTSAAAHADLGAAPFPSPSTKPAPPAPKPKPQAFFAAPPDASPSGGFALPLSCTSAGEAKKDKKPKFRLVPTTVEGLTTHLRAVIAAQTGGGAGGAGGEEGHETAYLRREISRLTSELLARDAALGTAHSALRAAEVERDALKLAQEGWDAERQEREEEREREREKRAVLREGRRGLLGELEEERGARERAEERVGALEVEVRELRRMREGEGEDQLDDADGVAADEDERKKEIAQVGVEEQEMEDEQADEGGKAEEEK
ncbi:hypothetical protein JCM8097_004170 [Rhodosporidiobolus ruineniae]